MSDTENNKKPKADIKPITPDDFDIKRLDESDFQDIEYVESQLLASVNYKNKNSDVDEKLIFVTPWVKHNVHGIPKIHEKYYPTDEKRSFIKFPLDEKNVPAVKPLINMLKKVDKRYDSKEWKQKKFGSDDNYTYSALVRKPKPPKTPVVKGKEKEQKKPEKKFDNGIDYLNTLFFRGKFTYDYSQSKNTSSKGKKKDSDKEKNKKKKKSDDSDSDDESSPKDDTKRPLNVRVYHTTIDKGKKKRKIVPVKTMTDVYNALPWNSEYRMVGELYRMWQNKQTDTYEKYLYGPTVKVLVLEIKPAKGGPASNNSDKIMLSSDDESDDNMKNNKKSAKNDSDVSDDDSNKSSKNKLTNNDSDSKKKKKPANDDSDDDKNKKKQDDDDSNDDDDDDDDKKKKKPTNDDSDDNDDKKKSTKDDSDDDNNKKPNDSDDD
jgi:hypothetical protein